MQQFFYFKFRFQIQDGATILEKEEEQKEEHITSRECLIGII